MSGSIHRGIPIRDVPLSAGEFPDKPCVHGSKQHIPVLSPLADARDMIQDPGDFRGTETGVDWQTGFVPDYGSISLFFPPAADAGTLPGLPANGFIHRQPGVSVPENGGFPLAGDANGGNLIRGDARLVENPGHDRGGIQPESFGVLLDPAGLRAEDCGFFPGQGADAAVVIEEHGSGGGCVLVNGQNVCCCILHDRLLSAR